MSECRRCDSRHGAGSKHDWPPGLVPVGKFTWWRLLRLLGPKALPPQSVARDLAAQLFGEAATDGADIRPGNKALAEWTGDSERGIEDAFRALAGAGLVFKAFNGRGPGRGNTHGRAAVWELAMRMEHELLLEAAGYDLEWLKPDGAARKYRHARKRPTSQGVGVSDD